jgi:hypothetical protein
LLLLLLLTHRKGKEILTKYTRRETVRRGGRAREVSIL